MATYNSGDVSVPASADTVYARFSNLENLSTLLEKVPEDKVPADKLEMLKSISITENTITLPSGPVGALTFRVKERVEPSLIRLEGEGTPVPVSLAMHITPVGDTSSVVDVEIDIAIPALLKPMVGPQIQKVVSQFGQVIKAIPFA